MMLKWISHQDPSDTTHSFKEVAEAIAEPLSIIFTKSFNEWCPSEAWKEAHIIPLFKKGKKSQPGNYRQSHTDNQTR